MPSDRLTWLGHATVLLELDGARLVTDPVLRSRIAHLRRHAPAPPPVGALDAVLISHAHHDHLDVGTLRALDPPPAEIVVPAGTAKVVRGKTAAAVREVAAGTAFEVGAAAVHVVPAVHDGRRLPFGAEREAVGYVVEAGGRRVYFAGDTSVFEGMGALGPLDVALVPIWGWGPSLGPGHMDPDEAVEALELLRPAVAVPIHWGTLLPIGLHRRHGHVLRQPVERFARAAAQRCPGVRLAVLSPGEGLEL